MRITFIITDWKICNDCKHCTDTHQAASDASHWPLASRPSSQSCSRPPPLRLQRSLTSGLDLTGWAVQWRWALLWVPCWSQQLVTCIRRHGRHAQHDVACCRSHQRVHGKEGLLHGLQGEGDTVIATVTRGTPGEVLIQQIEGDGGRLSLEAGKNCAGIAALETLKLLGRTSCGVSLTLKKVRHSCPVATADPPAADWMASPANRSPCDVP